MEQTEYDVFISYRRKGGSEKAQIVKSEIKQRGIEEERIFLDTHSLHDGDFEQKIKIAIDQSQCVIVIISKGCFDDIKETDFWYMEIREAMLQGKKVVPILFDGITSFASMNVPKEFLDLTKKNAVIYQHEYADAAFDKLLLFIGIQNETHNPAKKRGCLFNLRYKGCLLSVALIGLIVVVFTPITFMQVEQPVLVEGSDSSVPTPYDGEDGPNECFPDSVVRVKHHQQGTFPEKENEELTGRWRGLHNKLTLSFRANDVIMEKQDSGIVKTKQGEYSVNGNHIVFCWDNEDTQVVRYVMGDKMLRLIIDDDQIVLLREQ